MALRLDGKKNIVAEVSRIAEKAISVVAAEYAGLTVAQMTDLRQSARRTGVRVQVVRNTLARRAFTGTSFACMNDALVGPLVLAFSMEDPGAAARLMKDFSKKCEKLSVKALSADGKLYAAKDLDRLASLPTRNEAIAQLMGVMKAPVAKFVRTLAEPHAKLVRTLAAVRDQKSAA